MARLSQKIRQQVFARAERRCEYCLAPEIIGVSIEVDHIIPESAEGPDTLDNLCCACSRCNGSKLAAQTAIDRETNQEMPLYNPRSQSWEEHFKWSDDYSEIIGLTPTGRATVNRLHMNEDHITIARRFWVQVGLLPP